MLTEAEFLKSTSKGLREEEVDEEVLINQPHAVDDEILPADVLQSDGVHKG